MFRVFFRSIHCTVAVSVPRGARLPAVPRTIEEFRETVITPKKKDGEVVRVGFIGDPNVGKSTIINRLLETDICSVSKKPHTTRTHDFIAKTSEDFQIVFVDTPGAVCRFHAKKHGLPDEMIASPTRAVDGKVDVLAVVIDGSDSWRRDHFSVELKALLEAHQKANPAGSSVLILNKIDLLKSKRQLLSSIDSLTGNEKPVRPSKLISPVKRKDKIWEREKLRLGQIEDKPEEPPEVDEYPSRAPSAYGLREEIWPHFDKVFMVSAKEDDGIEDLWEYFTSKKRPGIHEFRENYVTRKDPHEITLEVVREKLLDHVRKEIPYEVQSRLLQWTIDESGSLFIIVEIVCKNDRHISTILGAKGERIQKITSQVREKLCAIFQSEICLKLIVVDKTAPKSV